MADTISQRVNVLPLPSANTLDGGLLLSFSSVNKFTKIRTFIADEAIEVGECLELDFAGVASLITTVAKTKTDADAVAEALLHVRITDAVATGVKAFIGVALDTVASGEEVRVCVGGYCPFVQTAGSVAAGDNLVPVAAGELITYAAGTHTTMTVVGFALDDDADQGSDPDEVGCAAWIYPTCP